MLHYSSIPMNRDEIFQIWAPDDSPWSPWVKPVLFAHLESPYEATPETARDVSWSPPADEKVALVVNLPGAEGVLTGIALAARGYRPVPLYNAVPLPYWEIVDPYTRKSVSAVNVLPILRALKMSTETLAHLELRSDAPPAFLLDFDRQGDGRKIESGEFDNRSISLTTDFPSAIFLASQGIQRAILIQKDGLEIQSDLAHSLRRWQDGGLKLERLRLDNPSPESFQVPRPSWYGAMFQRVLSQLGLRHAGSGGFGNWIPNSPAGG